MDVYNFLIHQDDEKAFQVRLVVSEFKGNYYLHIRKYFLSFEGEWVASLEGITFPYNLKTSANLFTAVCSMVSEAELEGSVKEEFKELIKNFGKEKYYDDDVPF